MTNLNNCATMPCLAQLGLGLILLGLGPAGSLANNLPPANSANRLLEEVIVTAQKREEKIQDVAISIQAFSGEGMDARGIETTKQMGQFVPSLQFTEVAGFNIIFMRGIGTDNFIPSADPSIATYIDGIYVPQGQGSAQSLGNIQRVEVLKGPQGTLFGRNATGGAISIVSFEPGEELELSAEAESGNFDKRQLKFSASGPLTHWLAASAAAIRSRSDNIYTNINYEVPQDSLDAYRIKVHFHPTENLSLSLTSYRTEHESFNGVLGKNTDPSSLGTALGIQPQSDDYQAVSDFHAASSGRHELDYAMLSWETALLDLKLLASDQLVIADYAGVDFDGSPMPIAAYDTEPEYSDLQTFELQLLSNDGTPYSDKLEWVTGLYYLKSVGGFEVARLRGGPYLAESLGNIASGYGVPAAGSLTNILGTLGPQQFQDGLVVQFGGLLGTKSYSAFAHATLFLNEWMDLTLGGRYQEEERYMIQADTGIGNPNGDGAPIEALSFPLESTNANNFSPKLVFSFHPRENALIYSSYAVGFKSGTYNVVNVYQKPDYIEPEKVTSYELGAKIDFLERRLRLNGAVFQNKIDNLQSGFVSMLGGGVVRFLTAGTARTRGAELDGIFLPFPRWNPGLALTGNVAYVEAQYRDFKNGNGFDPDSGIFQENLDLSGNDIVRTPKLSGGIGLTQSVDLESGNLELGIDAYYNSGFYYDAYNTVEEDSYSLWNARLSYLYQPWKLRLTAFVKNAADERYHVQQFLNDFGVIKSLAAPREYGFRLGWEY